MLGSLAKLNTPAGADAYAHYWMQTLDWAYATMTSSLARTAFVASCRQCNHFLDFDIDEAAAHGEHYIGGRLLTTSSKVQPNDGHAGATAVIDLAVSQTPFRLVGSAGSAVDQSRITTSVTFRTWLKWNGSSWRIADWKTAVEK